MKVINTSCAIHTNVANAQIAKAKKYLEEKFASKYSLPPHITHLLVPMPKEGFAKFHLVARKYLESAKTFKVIPGKIEFESKEKFFSIPFVSKDLQRIHSDLLTLALPFRNNCIRQKDFERMKKGLYGKKELSYIKVYGYPRVLDLNYPHISLGSIENETGATIDETEIKTELGKILRNTLSDGIIIDHFVLTHHTDAEKQSDMQVLFEEDVKLR